MNSEFVVVIDVVVLGVLVDEADGHSSIILNQGSVFLPADEGTRQVIDEKGVVVSPVNEPLEFL